MSGADSLPARPGDPYQKLLLDNVHPTGWRNPIPSGRYNLVVLGAGTAGLVTAAGAAGLGAKVALIEKHFLGGDCLNVGCVPSKSLIRSARAVAAVREAARFGIDPHPEAKVRFGEVMERMRRLRAGISPNDSARRFSDLGVDVFFGSGRFISSDSIEVAGQTLQFAKAVVATGARATLPPLPGLEDVPFLTNETLFSLTELPKRLAILGAGPIGCEMAQCFARFGSRVSLIESGQGILPRDDPDASRIVKAALERDGVQVICCGKELQVSRSAAGSRLRMTSREGALEIEVDQILIAAGRTPNQENLGLENIGVEFGAQGIRVDDFLRTTNPRVYACGDVCSSHRFTHAADFMARIVIQNALFRGRARASSLLIPWSTYTTPEVAHVGLSERTAYAQGIDIDTFTQDLAHIDRAILDDETEGFVRVHVRRGTDRIVGATVVAAHAGELINELTLAIQAKVGLKTLAATIHPYPTQAEAIRKIGDLYNRTRLTPRVKALMKHWLRWQR